MKHTKTYVDASGTTYTDTLENAKLVRRECGEGDVVKSWDKKIGAWLFTEENIETGGHTQAMVPFPPSPTYPLVSVEGEQVQSLG